MSASGPSRHIAPPCQFGRFRGEADIGCRARSAGLVENDPQQSFWASRLNLLVGWQTDAHRTHRVMCQERPRTPSQDAVSGFSCSDPRLASRSGFTNAMAMAPPTSIMTPHMKKPVLNPLSGMVTPSMILPMI